MNDAIVVRACRVISYTNTVRRCSSDEGCSTAWSGPGVPPSGRSRWMWVTSPHRSWARIDGVAFGYGPRRKVLEQLLTDGPARRVSSSVRTIPSRATFHKTTGLQGYTARTCGPGLSVRNRRRLQSTRTAGTPCLLAPSARHRTSKREFSPAALPPVSPAGTRTLGAAVSRIARRALLRNHRPSELPSKTIRPRVGAGRRCGVPQGPVPRARDL